MKKQKGFTLIELLIVIAIIAILAAIIYVAVDPARRIQEARDAQRWSSVNSILNAYLKYTVDNAGVEPTNATSTITYMISNAGTTGVTPSNETCDAKTTATVANLNALVPNYIAEIPKDPNFTNESGYYFERNSAGRITIGACKPERASNISVQR
jgi:prepilin-type N-terminal cleavage/methylation domain-containing protein